MKHDILRMESKIDEIQLRGKSIDSVMNVEEKGWGLRVFEKGVGFASGTGEVNWALAEKLSKLNKRPEIELPNECSRKKVDVLDQKLDSSFLEDFSEIFVSLLSDSPIVPTFSKLRLYDMKSHLSNSEGLDLEKREKIFRFETSLKIEDKGEVGEVFLVKWSRRPVGETEISDMIEGIEKCIGARPPESSLCDVILSPQLVCDALWPVLTYQASGEALYTGKSLFSEGESVAHPKLSIKDDGTYPYGILSSPFDGEGVGCRDVFLIKRGEFAGRINDLLYGKLTGLGSSGNGVRQARLGGPDNAYQVPPSLSGSNLVVEPGKKSLKKMIEETEKGVLVEECAWLNPDNFTGAFGSEIRKGFLIENGELGRPIKGGNLSGNVLEMIKRVGGVGKESEITSGHTLAAVSPYVKFEKLKVSA